MSSTVIKFNDKNYTINSYLLNISKKEYIGVFYKNIDDPKNFKYTIEKYNSIDFLINDNRTFEKILKLIDNNGQNQIFFLGKSEDDSNENKQQTLKWYGGRKDITRWTIWAIENVWSIMDEYGIKRPLNDTSLFVRFNNVFKTLGSKIVFSYSVNYDVSYIAGIDLLFNEFAKRNIFCWSDFDEYDWSKNIILTPKNSSESALNNIETKDSSLLSELDSLIGLKNIKHEIQSLVGFARLRKQKIERGIPVIPGTLHMAFIGNPGTGKTTVARLIGRIYKQLGLLEKGETIEVVARKDLVAGFIGQTAAKTEAVFMKALGGVLFIDEAYSLLNESEKDFGQEAIATLIQLMENYREKIVVIIAGYPEKIEKLIKSNPGLESRFSTYILFENYSKDELVQILKKMISDKMHTLTPGAEFKVEELIESYFPKNYFNSNARDVRNLFDKIFKNQSLRLSKIENLSDEDLKTITAEDIPDIL